MKEATADSFDVAWPVVGGLKIFTRCSNSHSRAGAVPIVLIHGLGVSGRYMMPTAERLAARHAVFVPDLPGFGKSDKPDHALSIGELADILVVWLATMNLQRPAFLGNSMGCQVIVDLAMRYPDSVDRAILVGPTVDRIGRTMPRQIMRGCRDLLHEPWSLWRILAHDYFVTGTARMYQTLREALADPVEEKLSRIQAPTLVVRGSRDPIAPQRWIEEMCAALPRGRLAVIPGGTHAANYTAADALCRIANDFLSIRVPP